MVGKLYINLANCKVQIVGIIRFTFLYTLINELEFFLYKCGEDFGGVIQIIFKSTSLLLSGRIFTLLRCLKNAKL